MTLETKPGWHDGFPKEVPWLPGFRCVARMGPEEDNICNLVAKIIIGRWPLCAAHRAAVLHA